MKIILLTSLLFLGIDSIAQPTFGIHIGPTYTWHTVEAFGPSSTPDGIYRLGSTIGGSMGLTADFRLADAWQLATGLTFTSIGGTEQLGPIRDPHISRVNYLSLPFEFRYKAVTNLHVGIGAGAHILLWNDYNGVEDLIILAEADQWLDISGILGVHYDISDRFGAGIRYHHGLLSNFKDDIFYTDGNGKTIGEYGRYNKYIELRLTAQLF